MTSVRMMDAQMARVPKLHFSETQTLSYDVYVRLGSDHFVLVGRSGSASQVHRLKAFETDLVPWFYIDQGEFPKYLEQTVTRSTALLSKGAQDRANLLNSVAYGVAAMSELTRWSEFSTEAWHTTERLANLVVDSVLTSPALGGLLAELQRTSELQLRHSVGVSLIALYIARGMGGVSRDDLTLLAAAGLLHDIGFVKLPEEIVTKKEDLLRPDERRLYQTHPVLGAKLLRSCSQIPSELITLVEEHHENAIGTGYPDKRVPERLHKLSIPLSLAERFTELTLGDGLHQDFLSPMSAVNMLSSLEAQPFPLELLKILERHFRPSSGA